MKNLRQEDRRVLKGGSRNPLQSRRGRLSKRKTKEIRKYFKEKNVVQSGCRTRMALEGSAQKVEIEWKKVTGAEIDNGTSQVACANLVVFGEGSGPKRSRRGGAPLVE